jgi:predicted RNA-binding Zn-ribbon protein involved in translation (DUF1610 family)
MSVVSLSEFKAARQKCEEVSVESEVVRRLSGPAKCLACGHEWDANVEAPAWAFKCPACGNYRGHFHLSVELPDDTPRLACHKCDNQAFQLTPLGTFCLGCGAYHSWDSMPPTEA